MIVFLSPAKTLDESSTDYHFHTQNRFLKQSQILINRLKKYDSTSLQQLMKISEKLALLNLERYHSFTIPFDTENAKPAILAFKGDVYEGLRAWEMTAADLDFAQKHIRILSGLYGLLRPMDLMQPYRLEMGTRLVTEKGKNLYEFWGEKITELTNQDLDNNQEKIVLNLASNEYFKAIKPKSLKGRVVHVTFKENKNGAYKIIAFYAKKARGMMARYIVQNRISSLEELRKFKEEDYVYNDEMSNEKELVFTRG